LGLLLLFTLYKFPWECSLALSFYNLLEIFLLRSTITMKLLSGFLPLISGLFLTVATSCNQDNCARAVNGSRNGLDFHSAKENCSSFLKVTVQPATITSTVTITIYLFTATQTSTSTTVELTTTVYRLIETNFSTITTVTETDFTTVGTITVQLQKRAVTPASSAETVQPTSVPAHASPCSGTVRYSSACYCLGITKTTVSRWLEIWQQGCATSRHNANILADRLPCQHEPQLQQRPSQVGVYQNDGFLVKLHRLTCFRNDYIDD